MSERVRLIAEAMQREVGAYAFFRHCAGLARQPQTEALFGRLAHDEAWHWELLAQEHQRLSGQRPGFSPGAFEEAGAKPVSAATDLASALRIALAREQEAEDLYRRAAEEVVDPTARELLLRLAGFERGHVETIQAEQRARAGLPWDKRDIETWVTE